MKNTLTGLLISLAVLLLGESCEKMSIVNTDKPAIDEQIRNAIIADSLSYAYNDTLAMIEDTVTVRLNNPLCISYDKLYHTTDSLFSVQYNLFGDYLYKYGKKMTGYTPPATLSADMRYSDGMPIKELVADTIIMNGLYTGMEELRLIHVQNHNGIYDP
jgi:hypothetical protein